MLQTPTPSFITPKNPSNRFFTQSDQFVHKNHQKTGGQQTNAPGINSYPSIKLHSQAGEQLYNTLDHEQYKNNYQTFQQQLSHTQKQILSHELISEIVQKSKKSTVQHNVNKISTAARLYSVPQQHNPNQFQFDSIPPTNQNFASSASSKVKQIHGRLSDVRNLANRLTDIAQKNKQKLSQSNRYKFKKRAQSADSQNVNKRVSVSGLVSYSFNSIKARRSLGYIPDKPEQQALADKVQESKKVVNSSLDRLSKIIRRKPTLQNKQKLQMSKAVVCDFHTPTDRFLKTMKQQLNRDKQIYGQRMQKLSCIKQYMEKQKTSYENASFIVQTIINAQEKWKQSNKIDEVKRKGRMKTTIDDDLQLSKRRRVLYNKKIMLRHLYFTE